MAMPFPEIASSRRIPDSAARLIDKVMFALVGGVDRCVALRLTSASLLMQKFVV